MWKFGGMSNIKCPSRMVCRTKLAWVPNVMESMQMNMAVHFWMEVAKICQKTSQYAWCDHNKCCLDGRGFYAHCIKPLRSSIHVLARACTESWLTGSPSTYMHMSCGSLGASRISTRDNVSCNNEFEDSETQKSLTVGARKEVVLIKGLFSQESSPGVLVIYSKYWSL